MEVLGIDFGGSGIKGAIVETKTGELVTERHRIETPQPATPDAVAEVMAQLTEHFNWKGKVGVGVPAVVKNGVMLTAANIDNSWIGQHVNKQLSDKTGCEVECVNDADAAGIAEIHFGAGAKEKGTVFLLTVGTGIGTVIFINKHLVPNLELGHLEFKGKTIERYSADSVRKRKDLSWEEWGKRFNKALDYYDKMFNPNLFIIGGGVSKKMDKFEEYIKLDTPVVPAEMENNAGIIGAALNMVYK
ncbi:polyphosphate glucokinase [Draconibacterium orientale]|jgi:polyphosphate glucokinase|uniref:Polyphosphate glucokinase n=1 Tax=Draconibacterium orientale TaxID=1168034 RepID=X5DIE9_9BACT|nr:ROK family protein [Draconibacterium orientale]AHW60879.1 polyphosphate glucokinase [Draconibacterium orientale]SES65522.1 polyphosphate glucokinase [Draconibacterium orientale]